MKKIKIEMTEEQQTWLLRFLNQEWSAELYYQEISSKPDMTYLQELLEVYKAVLGKPTDWLIALANEDDIKNKEEDIDALLRDALLKEGEEL